MPAEITIPKNLPATISADEYTALRKSRELAPGRFARDGHPIAFSADLARRLIATVKPWSSLSKQAAAVKTDGVNAVMTAGLLRQILDEIDTPPLPGQTPAPPVQDTDDSE